MLDSAASAAQAAPHPRLATLINLAHAQGTTTGNQPLEHAPRVRRDNVAGRFPNGRQTDKANALANLQRTRPHNQMILPMARAKTRDIDHLATAEIGDRP